MQNDLSTANETEQGGGVARSAGTFDMGALVKDLLARLDAEQARAFLRKMAELDAERQQSH